MTARHARVPYVCATAARHAHCWVSACVCGTQGARAHAHAFPWAQAEMAAMAERNGGSVGGASKLNNILMQMRKNCNHPDLITSAFSK